MRNSGKTNVSKSLLTAKLSAKMGDDCSSVYNTRVPDSVWRILPKASNRDSKLMFRIAGDVCGNDGGADDAIGGEAEWSHRLSLKEASSALKGLSKPAPLAR